MRKLFLTLSLLLGLTLSSQATDYKLVSDVSELEVGANYIIVYDTNAMGAIYSSNKYFTRIEINPAVGDVVTINDEAVNVLTLGGETNAYTFQTSLEGEYLALTANANNLGKSSSISTNSTWKITFDEGVANIVPNGYTDRVLQYNSNSGQERFACYKNTQKGPSLYKEMTGVAPTLKAPIVSGVKANQTYYESQTVKVLFPELATSMAVEILLNGESIYSDNDLTSDYEFVASEVGVYTVKASATDGTETIAAADMVFTIAEPIVVDFPKMNPDDVKEGRYVIAYTSQSTSYIMKNEVFSSHYVAATEFDLTTGVLPADEYIFTIKATEGGYTIQGSDETYLALVQSGTYVNLKPQQTDAFAWKFTGTEDAVQASGDGFVKYICFQLYNGTTPEFTTGTASGSYYYPVFYRVGDLPVAPVTMTVPAIEGYGDIYLADEYYPEFDFTIATDNNDHLTISAEFLSETVGVESIKMIVGATEEVSMQTVNNMNFNGTSTSEYARGATIEFYFELVVKGETVRTRGYKYQIGGETMTGICVPEINVAINNDVYRIDGVRILRDADADAINSLPKGIYIIGGKKVVK